jgi:hypothetical protein
MEWIRLKQMENRVGEEPRQGLSKSSATIYRAASASPAGARPGMAQRHSTLSTNNQAKPTH